MLRLTIVTLWLLLCCLPSVLHADGYTLLRGRVTSQEDQKPLPEVIVRLQRRGDRRVLAFTQTDTQGAFELKAPRLTDGVLHFALLGYGSDSIAVTTGRLHYDVALRMQEQELEEVLVEAKSLQASGDTIRYRVSGYAHALDKTLADVLKKMPGIEVLSTGQIKYNGAEINKFYIEGRDMLGSKYAMATNNISHEDVGSVEVIEGHQPIKVLSNISFSQSPAINIRLKEGAKYRWVGNATLSAGHSSKKEGALWNAELALMTFRKDYQSLNTIAALNTGRDLSQQANDLVLGDAQRTSAQQLLPDHLSVVPRSYADIDAERLRFGHSWLATTHNLITLGQDCDLVLQANYRRGRSVYEHSRTIHYTGYNLREQAYSQGKEQLLGASLRLTINRGALYLQNTLSVTLPQRRSIVDISGTYPNHQSASGGEREVRNDLHLVRRRGATILEVSGLVQYAQQPERLQLESPSLRVTEHLRFGALYGQVSTSIGRKLSAWFLSTRLGLSLLAKRGEIEADAPGLAILPSQRMSLQHLALQASPKAEYSSERLKLTLAAPLVLSPYRFDDDTQSERVGGLSLSPSVLAEYQVSSRLKAMSRLSYSLKEPPASALEQGRWLSSYHTIMQSILQREAGQYSAASLSLQYRDPMRALFASGGLSYARERLPVTYARRFAGDFIVLEQIEYRHTAEHWGGYGRLSKGFAKWRTIASLSVQYDGASRLQYQDGQLIPYTQQGLTLKVSLSLRPIPAINLHYTLEASRVQMDTRHSEPLRDHRLRQEGRVGLRLGKHLLLQGGATHYMQEIAPARYRHLVLLDGKAVYTFASGVECSLSWHNLLGQAGYSYTRLDALGTMSVAHTLRPREILLGVYFRI